MPNKRDAGQLLTKTFSVVPEIKADTDENEGVIVARFATFDVIDHDGDIIRPKSVGKQRPYAGTWDHAGGLPLGDVLTYEEKDAPYAELAYDLGDPVAQRQYRFLKRRADKGLPVEWSWVFHITKGNELPEKDPLYEPDVGFFGGPPFEIKKTDIVSVDPVGRGSGIDTAMVEAKHCGSECMAARAGKNETPTPEPTTAVFDYEQLAIVVAKAVAEALQVSTSPGGICGCKDQSDPETKGQGLGDLLRELRDEQELSNSDLAEASGLSIATIGQVLGGTHVPSAAGLQSFATALNVPLSRLASTVEADAKEEEIPDDDTGEKANDDISSDAELGRQIDALLAGVETLPLGVDPGAAAWAAYDNLVKR